MRQHFFLWYYTSGLRGLFATLRRVVATLWRVSSIGLLIRTLLAPWHRDVSLKNWRGINPARSAQRLLWNLFSRILGGIVRFAVITAMIVLMGIALIGGCFLVLCYVVAPLFIIGGFALLPSVLWQGGLVACFVGIGMLIASYVQYRGSRAQAQRAYRKMSITELHTQPWFYRVYERIGVLHKDVPQSAVASFAAFEEFLHAHDITTEEFEQIIRWETERQEKREWQARPLSQEKLEYLRPFALHWHFGYTVGLDRIATELPTVRREDRVPFVGHAAEMDLLELVLNRPQNNNALIIGPSGVGRKMLVKELARRVVDGDYDNTPLAYMRVMECDFAHAIAVAEQEGIDPELYVHNLFHEAAYAGNIILVVDHFDRYIDENRGFSFAEIVAQYAAMPTFRMIALAEEDAFHNVIEPARPIVQHFDVIEVTEMSYNDTLHALFTRFYGKEHTPFTLQALRHIIDSADRYMSTAPQPQRAIDLATETLLYWQRNGNGAFITPEIVNSFVTEKTGVPVGKISAEEKDTLLSLEEKLHERVVGQESAVQHVAEAVRRMRSGLARPDKPAGSFLFLGPTGVGKTETAKALAAEYFGNEEQFVRFDMTEFQGPQALERFIGSRELGQQGLLTTAVRDNPYALLLFDEIEKANPQVLDLLLQILDEGKLHDAFGRGVNFTTMVIIATSNAGALQIKKLQESGMATDDMRDPVINNLIESGAFRPELMNRFDQVVLFSSLTEQMLPEIAQKLLARFAARMRDTQRVTLQFDPGVAEAVVARGYDAIFGARSLVHYIDDAVADAIAKKIIAGSVARGAQLRFGVADLEV